MPLQATATLRPSAPVWRAGADKVAHAHRKGDRRTGCGLAILDERFAHTPAAKCPDCLAVFGLTMAARLPWSESELREAWGK